MSIRSEWADFFDDHAPVYDDNCFTKNTVAEVDFIIEQLKLPAGASIIDVGCGTGRHSVELAKRGYKMTGVDISSGMLDVAKKRAVDAGVDVAFINADATQVQLADQFDAAICLCEGAFGLLGTGGDPIEQPLAILKNIAAAMRPAAGCIFTVLNGYKMARAYTNEDVAAGKFDPLALAERSECELPEYVARIELRERGFVPTELRLLFEIAGLEVSAIWGGTAGNWGRRPIDLDEFEIMVVARKP